MFFSNSKIIYEGIKTNSTSINKLILATILKLLGCFGEVEGTLQKSWSNSKNHAAFCSILFT